MTHLTTKFFIALLTLFSLNVSSKSSQVQQLERRNGISDEHEASSSNRGDDNLDFPDIDLAINNLDMGPKADHNLEGLKNNLIELSNLKSMPLDDRRLKEHKRIARQIGYKIKNLPPGYRDCIGPLEVYIERIRNLPYSYDKPHVEQFNAELEIPEKGKSKILESDYIPDNLKINKNNDENPKVSHKKKKKSNKKHYNSKKY